MNQKQEKYYYDKLNEYEFIGYSNSVLTFRHSGPLDRGTRLMEADRSIPLLHKFLTSPNCPVKKITIDRCTILTRGILTILKENKTVTELNITYSTLGDSKHVLITVANFLKGNRTIQKLGLHLYMSSYMDNENDPQTTKLLQSLLGTAVTHLELRQNFLDATILKVLKEVIPKLRLQSLDLRNNLKRKSTKDLEETVIFIVRKNIFLERLFVENISDDTMRKLDMNLNENKCIRRFFRIFLENYGPKRLGLMDAQTRQSIRDPKKPRLDIDVRRIINQYIPRNIKQGVDNFITYLVNIGKCLDKKRNYEISDFVQGKNDVAYFEQNKDMIDPVVRKLTRYAGNHQYSITTKKDPFSVLSIGKRQTRGRKRKTVQMIEN